MNRIRFGKHSGAAAGGYAERSAITEWDAAAAQFTAVFVKNNSRQRMNFLRKFNHFMRVRAFRSNMFLTLRLQLTSLASSAILLKLRLSAYPPAAVCFQTEGVAIKYTF